MSCIGEVLESQGFDVTSVGDATAARALLATHRFGVAILDKNPLEDIRNSESVRYVMVNGRLYDAATLDQIGNHPEKRRKFYWEDDQALELGR